MATPENVGRVKMAGQTKSMIANGKLPASWLNSTELALRHNPAAAARLLAVGNRMQQNPVATANKLEAIQRGIVHAARMKSIVTGMGVAGAATVAAVVLAAMSSKAKAESAKPAAPPASPVKSMNSALDSAISAHDAHMVSKGKQPVAAPKLSGRDGTMDAAAIAGGGVSAGLAYLNSSAEKKAAAAPAPVKAPAPQAAQGESTGGNGVQTYTTADGRSVQGTAAQIASWEGRKK